MRSSGSTWKSGSRDPAKFDLDRLARQCDGFSGAEIEEAIISGLFDAFGKGSDLDTAILCNGLAETVPLSRTMSEELNRLRTPGAGPGLAVVRPAPLRDPRGDRVAAEAGDLIRGGHARNSTHRRNGR